MMSRNMKIVLGIIGGVIVCCGVAVIAGVLFLPRLIEDFADESLIEDPEEVARLGQTILEYDLPPAYSEEMAMSVMGINMIFAASEGDQNGMIMVTAFPEYMAGEREQMQQQMEDTFRRQSGRQDIHLVYKGSEDITINGKEASLSIYAGTDDAGNDFRQVSAIFETKEGTPGMLMIIAPLDSWDDQGFDDFFKSIE